MKVTPVTGSQVSYLDLMQQSPLQESHGFSPLTLGPVFTLLSSSLCLSFSHSRCPFANLTFHVSLGSWSVFCVCVEGRPSSGLGGSPWVMNVTLTTMGSFYNKKFTIVFLF